MGAQGGWLRDKQQSASDQRWVDKITSYPEMNEGWLIDISKLIDNSKINLIDNYKIHLMTIDSNYFIVIFLIPTIKPFAQI
jgi:hypothetical protein